MRRAVGFMLACLLGTLAACDAGRPLVAVKRTGPSAAPSVAVAPAASPSVAALETLQKPPGDSLVLAGTVAIDAGYVVAQGAGNIVASGGGNIVAAGGGNFVGHNGSAVVSTNAGNVIDREDRRLLADAAPAPGTVLPAAGMQISLLDLATDEPVSVGVDGAGKPVYTVLSDGTGHYQLYAPAASRSNLLVVARVPGHDDYRLSYDLAVSPHATTSASVDEDTALVTRFLRLTYQAAMEITMRRLLDPAPGANEDLIRRFNRANPAANAALLAVFGPQLDAIKAGLLARGLAPDQVSDEARRQADALLARVHLDEIVVDPGFGVDKTKPAVAALVEALAGARAAVAARMQAQAGPTYFVDVAPFKASGFTVRKATDVCEFICAHDFADPDRYLTQEPEDILRATGLDPTKARDLLALARAGSNGISLAITGSFLDPDTFAAVAKQVRVKPGPGATPIPHLTPRPDSDPLPAAALPSIAP